MEPTAKNSTSSSQKTKQKRIEAFRLLDKFERELARQLAFHEALIESLAGRAAHRQRERQVSRPKPGLKEKDEGFGRD